MIGFIYLFSAMIHPHIADGAKTVPMRHYLNKGALLSYDPIGKKLQHDGIDFHLLTGSTDAISRIPIASIGEHPEGREIICLDPYNAPKLMSKYQELLSLLKDQACTSFRETLTVIADFIKYRVFESDKCHQLNLERFINQWMIAHSDRPQAFTYAKDGRKIPVIPLDAFVEEGIGMCRHVSLATAFFLDNILKDPDLKHILPSGTVYHVRDQLFEGGHSWNIYISEDRSQFWHIDSFWELIANLNLIDEKESLYLEYGKSCIKTEIRRFFKDG
ncbi:MAG TPA: hypothetical protein VLG49_08235 [Rhabdochlamydiaceae bacterium]|nr:hypothetical protein [Rhabdochlamydiaceae bacterium]